MGMSILIEKESENNKHVRYNYGLSNNDIEKLEINKETLELSEECTKSTWKYGLFKAYSAIKRYYEKNHKFPDKLNCAS